MRVDVALDRDRISTANGERLHLSVRVTAPGEVSPPTPESRALRSPRVVALVLDRGEGPGPDGHRLQCHIALDLAARLDPGDLVCLITYDRDVKMTVPMGPLGDGVRWRRAVSRLRTGRGANLSGGLLRAASEIATALPDAAPTEGDVPVTADPAGTLPAHLLLVGSGSAVQGITSVQTLRDVVSRLNWKRVSFLVGAVGRKPDEDRLGRVAAAGGGTVMRLADSAGQFLGGDGPIAAALSPAAVTDLWIRVRLGTQVREFEALHNGPVELEDDGLQIPLGALAPGQSVRVLVGLDMSKSSGPESQWLGRVDVSAMSEGRAVVHTVDPTLVRSEEASFALTDRGIEIADEALQWRAARERAEAHRLAAKGQEGAARTLLSRFASAYAPWGLSSPAIRSWLQLIQLETFEGELEQHCTDPSHDHSEEE